MSAETRCHDCKWDTLSCEWGDYAEWYMLKDELWAQVAPEDPRLADPPIGMVFFLCIPCVEKRLGRRLTADDFSDARLNDLSVCDNERWAWSFRTPRLIDRLSRNGFILDRKSAS